MRERRRGREIEGVETEGETKREGEKGERGGRGKD